MGSEDMIGLIFDKIKDLLVLLISTVLDCIESAFDCMTYRKGKSLLSVLLAVWSFTPMTLIAGIFDLGFIHVLDAVIAGIFMTIIYSINNITKAQVESSIIFARDTAIMVEKKIKEKGGKSRHAKQ